MRIQDLFPLCKQTIVWRAKVGSDDYGKASYGAPVTFRGRRARKVSRVPSKGAGANEGADTLAQSTIWILAAPALGYDDVVYVQGDPEPYPPLLNIESYPDETGKDVYVKVTLGSAQG